jgi:hypothetical protein
MRHRATAPLNKNSTFTYPTLRPWAPARALGVPSYTLRGSFSQAHARAGSWATFHFPQNSFVWENKKIDSRPSKLCRTGLPYTWDLPARLALPGERPLELTEARLPGKRPTLQRGTPTRRFPGLPQPRPTPASLPCTSYIDTQAEAAAFSRAQVHSAYPGAGSRGEEPVVANAWQQDQHQHHTDLPYTGRHTPLQLSVKRRHHWGNRGEGRLTLSRS